MDNKKAAEIARQLGLGATGKYPQGKMRPGDEGELKSAIITEEDHIVILFGKSINWLALGADEALGMAKVLTERATLLKAKYQ